MSENVRESLQDLVTSKGWLLFREHARKEWGPEGYGRKLARVMDNFASKPVELTAELQKVHTATLEIDALLAWPDHELKRLEPKPEPTLSLHRVPR